jgi:hypothetical protein
LRGGTTGNYFFSKTTVFKKVSLFSCGAGFFLYRTAGIKPSINEKSAPNNFRKEVLMDEQDIRTARKKVCNLPDDPTVTDWDVGFVDGQLLSHGASRELILAVADGDHEKIREELWKVPELKRQRLIDVVNLVAHTVAKSR